MLNLSLPKGLKNQGLIFKDMACPVGDKLLRGDFHTVLDKKEADILQITKKWNYNG